MRLLNVTTFLLETFYEPYVPPYAALSHTWGPDDEEVSFHDIMHGFDKTQKNWQKVAKSAAEAIAHDLKYIWIDTCCIDKSSSAELSEAINSMFRWYRECQICFAYLADFIGDSLPNTGSTLCTYQLSKSRWFTRGWTLQELIAPNELIFYDSDWKMFGKKTGLAHDISEITGISLKVLNEPSQLRAMSIAQKMSWASERTTKRMEDIAYCLMGLFDVNMPLLYGEGRKAFGRLQEEIMTRSADQSLFAWRSADISGQRLQVSNPPDGIGILAPQPACFRNCADIVPYPTREPEEPYVMTNRGLRIEIPLLPIENGNEVNNLGYTHLAFPRCRREDDLSGAIAIPLMRTVRGDITAGHDSYRVYCADLVNADHNSLMRATNWKIYVHAFGLFWRTDSPSVYHRCLVQNISGLELHSSNFCEISNLMPMGLSGISDSGPARCRLAWPKTWQGMRAVFCFSAENGHFLYVILTIMHKRVLDCNYLAGLDVDMSPKRPNNVAAEIRNHLMGLTGVRQRRLDSWVPSSSIVIRTPIHVEIKLKKIYDEEVLTIEVEAGAKLELGKHSFDRSLFGFIHHNDTGSGYIALTRPLNE